MREGPKKPQSPQFLSGWKEIANYLGKGVRTVQRYERLLGLPVRRPAGKPWGSVVATRAELDGWVTASPIRDAFHLSNNSEETYAVLSKDIQLSIKRMGLLHDQMSALRTEVMKSVEVLQASVYELQGEMSANRSSDSAVELWDRAVRASNLRQQESDVPPNSGRYPKAS